MATELPRIRTIAGGGTDPGDGLPATATSLNGPTCLALDANGHILIGDSGGNVVRILPHHDGVAYGRPVRRGHLTVLAGTSEGDSGPDGQLAWQTPIYVAASVCAFEGNLFVVDYVGSRVRMAPHADGTYFGQPMRAGYLHTIAGIGKYGFSGEGGPGPQAKIIRPMSVRTDPLGNVYLADFFNHRIRMIPAADGVYYGQAMRCGHIYTIAGTGEQGIAADGAPATASPMNAPHDVAFDPAGNLYIADMWNHRIVMVPIHDGTYFGRPMQAYHLYTIAGDGTPGYTGDGGKIGECRFDHPQGLSTDAHGNLAVVDLHNHAIRIIAVVPGHYFGFDMEPGTIRTVAGRGKPGYGGDGGFAVRAMLQQPYRAVWAGPRRLLIADMLNNRIREVYYPSDLAAETLPHHGD